MKKLTGSVALLIIAGLLLFAVSRSEHPSSRQTVTVSTVIPATPFSAATPAVEKAAFGRLPMHFEPNQGQTDDSAQFLARGQGYTLFLTPTGATLALQRATHDTPGETTPAETIVQMKLIGANPQPKPEGGARRPGKSNYFIGNDPKHWHTNVPHYGQVHYHEVYSGIDLVYYGNPNRLQYDFIVAPGADPEAITLSFEGADEMRINEEGTLELHIDGGKVTMAAPVLYQEINKERRPVSGSFVQTQADQIGFAVAAYDPTLPLVIDPELVYSTYQGGVGCDRIEDIVLDASGNAVAIGYTNPFACRQARIAEASVLVTKLDPDGALVYSTTIGGTDFEIGYGIAVDTDGNTYLTGYTNSDDFPTTNAFQATLDNFNDAFVAKLGPDGSISYSTYLGGADTDIGYDIAVDADGNAYVTGETNSNDFPTANALQATHTGNIDAFVSKLSPSGTSLVYSTYLGGAQLDKGLAIVANAEGTTYLIGQTRSDDFPTANAFQATYGGGSGDAFVTKLSPDGTSLAYSTYLGGQGVEISESEYAGIAIDAAGNAYVTGNTTSNDFPTANAFQATLAALSDAFVSKLSPDGTSLVYSTYLGGTDGDTGTDIAVDADGNAYITGDTYSDDFPTEAALQETRSGFSDAFVTKLSPDDASLVASTYLGGTQSDFSRGMALGTDGSVHVGGYTNSVDFPTAAAAQGNNGGDFDAIIFRLALDTGINVIDVLETAVARTTFEVYNLGPQSNEEHLVGMATTNDDGKIEFQDGWFQDGDGVKLRRLVHTETATKASHTDVDNITYQIVLDNGTFDNEGNLYFPVYSGSLRTIPVYHTTILFNLIISIEWDADDTFINGVVESFRKASNYIYDVSNGQLHFNKIAIYDDRRQWDDADVRIYASNQEWPRASIFGFKEVDNTHVFMPRQWLGNADASRSDQTVNADPQWTTPFNYRTLAHEFGHYGLGFYDEYIDVSGNSVLPGVSLGFMRDQYPGTDPLRSEMSSAAQYEPEAHRVTKQWATRSMSCWDFFSQTFARMEAGVVLAPILVPDDGILPGPNDNVDIPQVDVGTLLQAVISNFEGGTASRVERFTDGNQPVDAAEITVIRAASGLEVEQGKTAATGQIRLLGSTDGDRVRAFKNLDDDIYFVEQILGGGGKNGAVLAEDIVLQRAEGDIRWINMVRFLSPDQLQFDLRFQEPPDQVPEVEVYTNGTTERSAFGAQGGSAYRAMMNWTAGDRSRWTLFSTDASDETFFVPQSLATRVLTGDPDVDAVGEGAMAAIDPANGIQRMLVLSSEAPTLRDGLASSAEQAGPAQAVAVYPDRTALQGRNTILIRYLDSDLDAQPEAALRVFRWDVASAHWMLVGGTVDTERNEVVAAIDTPGTYAAFTVEATAAAPTLNSLSPSNAVQGASGVMLSLQGQNFQDGATASVSGNGVSVTSISRPSATLLRVTLNVAANAAPGLRNVTVTNPDGQQATLSGALEVLAQGSLVAFLDWDAPDAGETLVPPDNLTVTFGTGGAAAKPGTPTYRLGSLTRTHTAAKHRPRLTNPAAIKLIDEIEPNNIPEEAQRLTGPAPVSVNGNLEADDEGAITITLGENFQDDLEDLFVVTTSAPGLNITLDGFTSDADLYLIDESITAVLGASTTIGATDEEEIDDPLLPADTYFIGVSIFDADPIGGPATPYKLTVTGALEGGTGNPPTLLSYNVYRSTEANAFQTGVLVGSVAAPTTTFADALPSDGLYHYQVTAVYDQGESAPSAEQVLSVAVPVEKADAPPSGLVLDQNYPNPFQEATTIPFALHQPGRAILRIYNLLGQQVQTVDAGYHAAGSHVARFGRAGLPSGVYIYELEMEGIHVRRTMLLIR